MLTMAPSSGSGISHFSPEELRVLITFLSGRTKGAGRRFMHGCEIPCEHVFEVKGFDSFTMRWALLLRETSASPLDHCSSIRDKPVGTIIVHSSRWVCVAMHCRWCTRVFEADIRDSRKPFKIQRDELAVFSNSKEGN